MEIRLAVAKDKGQILKYDRHIPHSKVGECIYNGLLDVQCDGDRARLVIYHGNHGWTLKT